MSANDENRQAALQKLHEIVAQELTQRISSGEAKPADIAAAIKFLKDNEITVGHVQPGSSMDALIKKMPFQEETVGPPDPEYLN